MMWRRAAAGVDVPEPDRRIARWSRWVTLASALLFTLVATRWQPWNLFARLGYTTDFYDAQAHSMLRLRFDVPPEVAGPEGFVVDGDTFVYFGPMLSIVRLPFALFGHWADGRLVVVSMVLGLVVLCAGVHHLALEARRHLARVRPERDASADHLRVAGLVAAAALSPLLYLAGWPSVYHETELWGAALLVVTTALAMRLWREPGRRVAAWTVLACAATLLTRATMGFGAALVTGVVGLLLWRRARTASVTVLAGTAVAGAVQFAVNHVKLGSFVEMPWQQQVLSMQSPTRSAWLAGNGDSFFSTDFLTTTLLHYLRPDTVRFERLLPFVRFGPPASVHSNYPFETVTASGSLTATATALLVLAVAGTVVLVRARLWVWAAALAGAALAALPSFMIGFIAGRYLADMVPMLIVPAALAAVALPLPTTRTARRALAGAVAAVLLWGAWSNAALAAWVEGLKDPDFTELRYRLDDTLFGDPAPSITTFDPAAPVPRDGVIALQTGADGRCETVYVAGEGAWIALERHDGEHQLTGRLTLTGDGAGDGTGVPVVVGDGWTISAHVTTSAVPDDSASSSVDGPATARFRLTGDGLDTTGDPVTFTPGEALTVRVVADATTRELSVTVDGTLALYSFAVPPLPMSPAADFAIAAADPDSSGDGESLCDLLERRR